VIACIYTGLAIARNKQFMNIQTNLSDVAFQGNIETRSSKTGGRFGFIAPNTLHYLAFQSLDFEHT
jgi:hypothetical protein